MIAATMVPALAEDYKITVTNTNNNISIAGKTYTAYKLFDATYSGTAVSYTIDKDSAAYTDPTIRGILDNYFTFTTASGNAQNIVVQPKDNFTEATARTLADDLKPYLSTIGSAGSAKVPDGKETVDITVTGPGYYLVDGSATAAAEGDTTEIVAAVALTSAKPTATVNPKADAPSVDKKITKVGESTTKVYADGKLADGSVGEKVSYELSSKVPDMTGYASYAFVYVDTMSKGLTFNDDVVVTIDGTVIHALADKVDGQTYYTVTTATGTDDATIITITFSDFIKQLANKGKDIKIAYSATINEKAYVDTNEENEVVLKYSHNPYDENLGKPGEVLGETPKIKTVVYTTNIELTKVAADGSTQLKGAKFSISGNSSNVNIVNKEMFKESATGTYYRLKDGTYTTDTPTPATAAKFDGDTKYEKVTVVDKTSAAATGYEAQGWVDANSVLSFNGLGEGTYTITELVSPEGYNLLKDPITVKITFDKDTKKFSATVSSVDGTVTENNHKISFSVKNTQGTELPSTGGIGTTLFYVGGGILVLLAVVLLVTKKRMGAND